MVPSCIFFIIVAEETTIILIDGVGDISGGNHFFFLIILNIFFTHICRINKSYGKICEYNSFTIGSWEDKRHWVQLLILCTDGLCCASGSVCRTTCHCQSETCVMVIVCKCETIVSDNITFRSSNGVRCTTGLTRHHLYIVIYPVHIVGRTTEY